MKCKCQESSAYCGDHFPECHLYVKPVLYGWLCPACGGGVSPFVSKCPCTIGHKPLEWYCSIPVDFGAGQIRICGHLLRNVDICECPMSCHCRTSLCKDVTDKYMKDMI